MKRVRECALAALVLSFWGGAVEAQEPCGAWTPVSVPAAAGHGLASVSASSAGDAWAVWRGVYHWDGTAWNFVSAPGLGSPDTSFSAVAAVAPGDAWIVGAASRFGSPQTLVQRWNGSAWSVVPSPVIPGGSALDAVDALGAGDAWAVGYRAGGHPEFEATRVTLTAHWNGSTWTAVPSPNVSDRSHSLHDVEMIASDDVWAVGDSRDIGGLFRTLILHWDGSTWSVVPSPNLAGENSLTGISAVSASDVWAVGGAWDGVTARQILLHWDGSSWTQVGGPDGPISSTSDVVALGPDDVWTVGSTIAHWNGSEWSLAPNPDLAGAIGMGLRSVTRIGACDAWAVGSSFDDTGGDNALSLRLAAGGATTNLPPVAMASAEPASGPGPLEVRFSSAGSHDPDGSIVSYSWNFGDGFASTSAELNPVHTYVQTGSLTYHATLRVQDDRGAFREASAMVRITPPVHVEDQVVTQVPAGSAWSGRDVVLIVDPDLVPVPGATVTVQSTGPTNSPLQGTTGADGRVTLLTPSSPDTSSAWCFTVTHVEKDGFVYDPAANAITQQCESAPAVAVEDPAAAGALALRIRPNPTRGEALIHLTLPIREHVRVTIVDPAGRHVADVGAATVPAGDHVFRWDGRDAAGRTTAAGLYFVSVHAGDRRASLRMLRLP